MASILPTRHLQAIKLYLDSLGINDMSRLPTGKGKPPREDPQIFLGAIMLSDPLHSIPLSLYLNPQSFSSFSSPPLFSFLCYLHSTFVTNTTAYEINNILSISEGCCLMLPSIHHPRFTRLNDTHYLMSNLDNKYKWYVHVGQIMVYLAFDQHIQKHNGNIPWDTGWVHRLCTCF